MPRSPRLSLGWHLTSAPLSVSSQLDEQAKPESLNMPVYEYRCDANGQTIDVAHKMDAELTTWLEVCYVAQIPMGDTDPLSPVRRVLTRAPGMSVVKGNAELREQGFTKLVKREDGVYENVTAKGDEARVVHRDD
ncbi:MAG: hypothetical protein ACI9W2_000203 [Gammaproteobacteria bacterium]|jgi:hypothetical protein